MICLRQVTVSSEVFDTILELDKYRVRVTDNIKQYYYGYKKNRIIYVDQKSEYLICRFTVLNYVCRKTYDEPWKQVIVRRREIQTEKVEADISGLYAWNYINRLLRKYYSNTEMDERLKMFEADYNDRYKQYHSVIYRNYKITKFEDCVKYDINGAHADALRTIFPKAEEAIVKLYEERKVNPINKQLMNYYVGFLKRKGYEKTYNWIVQRTTKMLYSTIVKCNGLVVYANTDGVIISKPKSKIETSRKLGDFKLEYEGDVYTYGDSNYSVVQFGDQIVGNAMYQVRDHIDLRVNKVVKYDKVKKFVIKTADGDDVYKYDCENVREVIL